MRRIADSVHSYYQAIPGRLFASVLLSVALAQAYWAAFLIRLLVNMGSHAATKITWTRLETLGSQSAQHEFGVLLMLILLGLVLAGIPRERKWIYDSVITGAYCLVVQSLF